MRKNDRTGEEKDAVTDGVKVADVWGAAKLDELILSGAIIVSWRCQWIDYLANFGSGREGKPKRIAQKSGTAGRTR